VLADLAFGVGAGGVVVRAEVDELCVVVGEQRPDDDQDRAADRDDGPLLAATAGDPPISLAEEAVGAGGADGGLAEYPGQVAVALTAGRFARRGPADSLTPGAKRAQEARCAGVGNRAMSVPTSARISCAAVTPTLGISSSRAIAWAKGAIWASILSCTVAMSAVMPSIRCSIRSRRNAW
jgi:hypothetical protein